MLEESIKIVSQRLTELRKEIDVLKSKKIKNHKLISRCSDAIRFNSEVLESLLQPSVSGRYVQ